MWTCTACRSSFASFAEQKDHFRTDWHRYNLKRKVVELPPVTDEQFQARMQKVLQEQQAQLQKDPKQKQLQKKEEMKKTGVKTMMKCVPCNKTFTTSNAYENHLAAKKHLANVKNLDADTETTVETITKKVEIVDLNEKKAVEDDVQPEAEEESSGSSMSLEEYKKQIPLEKEDCIFCSHHAESFDANLTHMLKEHGFFIPDVEYLVDAEGLVGYLAEKVKLGHFCLYCNGKGKSFRSYQDVQKHMIALSHCKLLYGEDEDLEELVDFYDFSSQYAALTSKTKQLTNGEAEAEEVEWETDSEASIDDDEEVVEVDDESGEEEEEVAAHMIEVSDTGELILANGKRVGRREFRRYYRQKFRPDEHRESVLAATRERLLLTYQMAGVDARAGSTALSTAFVAHFMRRRNNIAGGQTIVEAKRQRTLFEKQRGRLDFRSHKLQKNPNRRAMVTV